MDERQLSNSDRRKEAQIRASLEYYKDRRLLKMKFENQLNEHLAKTGRSESQIVERLQKAIIAGISNG